MPIRLLIGGARRRVPWRHRPIAEGILLQTVVGSESVTVAPLPSQKEERGGHVYRELATIMDAAETRP